MSVPATDPESTLRLDHFLCFSLYATSHALQRLYTPLLDDLGLTYAQYLVMVLLWERDPRAVGELGERLTLESSTLTPLIKRLEAAALVTRRRSDDDQRVVLVSLTEAGRALQARATHIPACVFQASGLDLPELLDLKTALDALRARLTAER